MVIAISDDLTGERRKEAITAGPPYVDTDPGYPELTDAAGFEHVQFADVTTEYLQTLTAWWREWDAAAVELIEIVGNDDYIERQANRSRAITAIRDGLLRRYLISAVRT